MVRLLISLRYINTTYCKLQPEIHVSRNPVATPKDSYDEEYVINILTNRTFENKYGVNKNQQNEKATSWQSGISTLKSSCSPKKIKSSNQIPKLRKLNTEITKMDTKFFIIGSSHAKLWRLSADETTVRKHAGKWSRETSYPGQEHYDAGMTITHNTKDSIRPIATELKKLRRNSRD